MKSVLKPQTVHINPTDRIEIGRSELQYKVRGEGAQTHVELRALNWNALRPKLAPGLTVSVDFQQVGKPAWTEVLGNVQAALVKTFGVMRLDTAGGFDPSHLSATLKVSDPKLGHRIVASGSMHKPDIDETEREDTPENEVNPVRTTKGKRSGLIDMITSEDTAGPYDITLRGVATPVLRVHPSFGKATILNNRDVQMAVLPEVFRRIVTELVLTPDDFDGEPWAARFKEFAAEYAPTCEWEYYLNAGSEDRGEVNAFVGEGVKSYYRFLCNRRVNSTDQSIVNEE